MEVKPQSYYSLASLMGSDRELAVFRRFNTLTMLNLLRRQADLGRLEAIIKNHCKRKGKDFNTLQEPTDTDDQVALEYLDELRGKLKEYRMYSLIKAPLRSEYIAHITRF